MAKDYYAITLALAGICQSAELVRQLAHDGQCDKAALRVSLQSILRMDAHSTLAVFGEHERDLKLGLETLLALLSKQQPNIAELMRYVVSIMALQRKLNRQPNALQQLASRLQQLERQSVHFDVDSETIQGSMADTYIDIIGALGPRIQVTGSATVLQRPQIQAQVRAALLAGIRSAVLWHQVGGNRLQIIFSRYHLLKQTQSILASC